nr:YkgJ family cysteine cluster protein [candidate division Zixibacteria bacterium]
MRELENLKEHILKDYPRLDRSSQFTFACHKNVPCFNECCGDVNIFLTPYDIIRLKKNLRISSTEFLKKYTLSPFDKNLKYPVILLMMGDDAKKKCPFVGEQGCRVYPDRPWACRMYPLGMASPGDESPDLDREFYFLLRESICKGFNEDRQLTVEQWLDDQGINEYDQYGEYFKKLTTHRFFLEGGKLTPQKIEMFFLACYDIDRFRNFVFESSFLEKFEVDDVMREKIRRDDLEMLKFGYNWLRFSMFGDSTMTVRQSVYDSRKAELDAKMKKEKD